MNRNGELREEHHEKNNKELKKEKHEQEFYVDEDVSEKQKRHELEHHEKEVHKKEKDLHELDLHEQYDEGDEHHKVDLHEKTSMVWKRIFMKKMNMKRMKVTEETTTTRMSMS